MTALEISSRLQWTQTQDKGDLMLPVPALRIKGKKPDELATEWAQKVGLVVAIFWFTFFTNDDDDIVSGLDSGGKTGYIWLVHTILFQARATHEFRVTIGSEREGIIWYKC